MEKEAFNLEILEKLIHEKNVIALRELFESIALIDIADVANHIDDPSELLFIFKTVKSEYTAEFFSYLAPEVQEKLVRLFTDKDLMTLIASSYTDDIADFLIDMPSNLVERVLNVTDKQTREVVNLLLNYKVNTAGSIMTTEYVTLNSVMTVEEALNAIRKIGREAETVYTNFVIDDQRNLVGTVALDDLIFSEPNQRLTEIMATDFTAVEVTTDQEEVARDFKRYNLNAMPVLNEDHRLVGIVTVDDVIDVIEQQVSEDMAKMAAVSPLEDSYIKSSVWTLAKKCIPWLIILLVLGIGASIVLNVFENSLAVLPILAAFIPILMDGGGNAGNQTTVLVTRSLALNEITPKDFLKVIWKEMRISLIVSAFVGLFAFGWVLFEFGSGILEYDALAGLSVWSWFAQASIVAALVAFTLAGAIILSKTIGAVLPLAAKAVGLDPAVVASPLLTTIVDVCALLLYFFLSASVFNLL
ncbi:MAG: magnesium transporter [Firmicutes bacterium]|nr:magnesium transporter [Bacillota bacterium]